MSQKLFCHRLVEAEGDARLGTCSRILLYDVRSHCLIERLVNGRNERLCLVVLTSFQELAEITGEVIDVADALLVAARALFALTKGLDGVL